MKKQKAIIKAFMFFVLLFSFENSINAQTNYVDIVKKDLKKTWKANKEAGKIHEEKGDLFISGKEGGYLIVYRFSRAKILKGDLNKDGKDEHIVIVGEEGGGAGGNVSSNENYIIYNEPSATYEVKQIMDNVINPPQNDDGCYFEIENIKNGFLYGTLYVCSKRGESKYDDIWKEIKTKCQLKNNKLELVN